MGPEAERDAVLRIGLLRRSGRRRLCAARESERQEIKKAGQARRFAIDARIGCPGGAEHSTRAEESTSSCAFLAFFAFFAFFAFLAIVSSQGLMD